MNFNKFLTKINVRVERTFGLTPMNYRNNGLICRMPRIKHSFEHKSEPNFWSNSLFLNHKRNLFDGKRCSTIATSTRSFTEMRGSGDKGIPEDTPRNRPLMTFKPILFPNLWYKWKNFISINTIIRPFFDNEFTINQFMFGAKQALVRISNCLADGDFASLKGLITEEALNEIQSNYYLMNSRQRTELRVNFDDIMLSFAYRIGIIMNDDNRRWVEITVVYYCLYKYKSLVQTKQMSLDEFRQRFSNDIIICNYRFIREYTKGVESEWSVNLLGHFTKLDSL